jgi:hypothetical protein
MKRNKTSSRAMRNKTTAALHIAGDSKYARKRRGGRMMYGPGCGPRGLRQRAE